MSKIWITGIAGFLGSNLASELIKRKHVVGGNDSLVCGDRKNVPKQAYFAHVSCNDKPRDVWRRTFAEELKRFKPDILVHCAATAHEGFSVFSPHFITSNIFDASVATFSHAIASGVKKIVNMSSMARYGRQKTPFTENATPCPVDPYGIAKVASENVLKVLAGEHGIKYTTLVPHNIIGVGQKYTDPYRNVASIMINRCKQGKPIVIYGDGSQRRCFSPIDDVLSCIVMAVENDFDQQVINIGPDGDGMTILELGRLVQEVCGTDTGFEFYDSRPCEVSVALCSSDKARNLLGYKKKMNVKKCLQKMADAIQPKKFEYDFPIEITTERLPRTWSEKRI